MSEDCPNCARQQYRIDALLVDLANAEADLVVKRRQITALKREMDDLLANADPRRTLADYAFAYWRAVCNPRAREFGRARRKAVSARIKAMTTGDPKLTAGEALVEIFRACDGASHDAFVKDGKPFNDLELICRDATTLQRNLDRQARWEHRLDTWMAAQWPEFYDPDWYEHHRDEVVALPQADGQDRMVDLRAA